MSTFEKKLLGALLISISIFVFFIYMLKVQVEEAGGFSQIIIGVGKEFKHISKEIDKD